MIKKYSQYRYLLFTALFFGGITLPAIAMLPINGATFTLPKLLLFSLAGMFGTLWIVLRNDVKACDILRTHWFGRFFIAYILISVLSLAWSIMPVVSFLGAPPRFGGVLFFLVCSALAVSTMNICQHPRGLRNIINAITVANTLVVIYGLLQLADSDPLNYLWDKEAFLGRIFSSVGQPNTLGAYIVLTSPFIMFKALNAQNKSLERHYYAALSAANIVVLLGTASRAAIIGFVIMLIAFLNLAPYILKDVILKWNIQQKIVAGIIALLVASIGFLSFERRFSLTTEQGRSWGTRQIVWFDVFDMIRDRPVGYGHETMGTVYPRYMSPQLHYTESLTATVDRAHNKPLDLLLTVGPLGLILYYGFVISLLMTSTRLRRSRAGLFAGGLGILGYSITLMAGFETILTQATFWIIAGLMMGLVWQVEGGHKARIKLWHARIAACILSCVCMMSSVIYLQWTMQRFEVRKAETSFYQGELSQSLQQFYGASKLFALDRTLLARFAETALISIEFTEDNQSKEVLHAAAKQSLDLLSDLTKEQDGMVPLLRAWQAALKGNMEEVNAHMLQAKTLMPNTVDTYRIAAHSYSLAGDRSAAAKAHADLIELLPPYWKDTDSEAARILWKENPWLEDLQSTRTIRSQTQWEM